MKATLYSIDGKKKGDVALPELFELPIREDIVQKYYETYKFSLIHPYSPAPEAGRRHSASGKIRHKRHAWGAHYGRGISRAPRKTMWRRGTQFYWIGAEVSGARGGRRAHAPQLSRRYGKINKKEREIAINSAIAATANKNFLIKRYSSLNKIDSVPAVIESLPSKTKELISTLRNIFADSFFLALKKKEVRAGRGKTRGRKYKSNSGLLIITSIDEKAKFKGIDVKSVKDLEIKDLYPLGRLTLFTSKAINELGGKK